MSTKPKSSSKTPTTMEELLASSPQKLVTLRRGQEVEGEITAISDKEIVLDLGTKSEGILLSREIVPYAKSTLKLGDKLKAYVALIENEGGQTVLSLSPVAYLESTSGGKGARDKKGSFKGSRAINWSRFIQVQNQKSKLQGKVLEINKGGAVVEVLGMRGFLPNSQVGFELMSKVGQGLEGLIGQTLTLTVIEVDASNNKLIFSQRGPVSEDTKLKLTNFHKDQITKGKIVAILPFGLVVDVGGAEGLVFISDVSWEKIEDLSKSFSAGQDLEVKVLGQDLELGRLNLSIKHLTEDPFAKLAEQFPTDEVVKGKVAEVSEAGIRVELTDGTEGFLPSAKKSTEDYEVGQNATFLVDGVDMRQRRINLAPFVTSTEGLIYK